MHFHGQFIDNKLQFKKKKTNFEALEIIWERARASLGFLQKDPLKLHFLARTSIDNVV